MKIKLFSSYSFIFLLMTFLIIYYINNKLTSKCDCDCEKKEGMSNSNISSGSTRGYIKRQIHPIKRQIKNSFTGSLKMTDYYTNKLNQIFR